MLQQKYPNFSLQVQVTAWKDTFRRPTCDLWPASCCSFVLWRIWGVTAVHLETFWQQGYRDTASCRTHPSPSQGHGGIFRDVPRRYKHKQDMRAREHVDRHTHACTHRPTPTWATWCDSQKERENERNVMMPTAMDPWFHRRWGKTKPVIWFLIWLHRLICCCSGQV